MSESLSGGGATNSRLKCVNLKYFFLNKWHRIFYRPRCGINFVIFRCCYGVRATEIANDVEL